MADVVQQPAHVALDVDPDRCEWIELVIGTPAKEDPQIGLAVLPGQAAIATEVGRHRGSQDKLTRGTDTGAGDRKRSHVLRCVTSDSEHQSSRRGR